MKIVRNRDLLPEISKSGGQAPIHAVVLLGKLQVTGAISGLLELLPESNPDELVYSGILRALRGMSVAARSAHP